MTLLPSLLSTRPTFASSDLDLIFVLDGFDLEMVTAALSPTAADGRDFLAGSDTPTGDGDGLGTTTAVGGGTASANPEVSFAATEDGAAAIMEDILPTALGIPVLLAGDGDAATALGDRCHCSLAFLFGWLLLRGTLWSDCAAAAEAFD